MSLAGTGAVAIWHDIIAEGRDAFYEWHGCEHMLERVSIPGLLRGRRFVAVDASLEFFTLYEARSLEVLKGEDYRSRLNNPTPWTLEAVKHFRSVARSICHVASSTGAVSGGLIATLRYDVKDARRATHQADLARTVLARLDASRGIAAVHMLVADLKASGESTAEQKKRGEVNAVPRYIVAVEGWGDEKPFINTVRTVLSEAAMTGTGALAPFSLDFYRHQVTADALSGL